MQTGLSCRCITMLDAAFRQVVWASSRGAYGRLVWLFYTHFKVQGTLTQFQKGAEPNFPRSLNFPCFLYCFHDTPYSETMYIGNRGTATNPVQNELWLHLSGFKPLNAEMTKALSLTLHPLAH